MIISAIIPTYNEESQVAKVLSGLIDQRCHEIIVVDGYSQDRTREIVRGYPVTLIQCRKCRACQMNAGARCARGDILLFLHADCTLEEAALQAIIESVENGLSGGCLRQRIDSAAPIYRIIEFSGQVRAATTRIFYGDQAIFVRKDVFQKIGGFDDVELFDDVIFSKKMKEHGKTGTLKNKVFSSARRWEKAGILKTTVVNWILTLGFLLGISPKRLKNFYCDVR